MIETLQGFRDGIVKHNGRSGELFKKFLLNWDVFKGCVPQGGDAEDLARTVYGDCRCALLHSGSTGDGLTVGVSGEAFAFNGKSELNINRTRLHEGLKREFDSYLVQLLAADRKTLRANFRKKMDAIAGA